MKLILRRVTSTAEKTTNKEKQDELFQNLLEKLSLDLASGVLPSLIIGSDEFGIHYFPSNDYTYDYVGSKHVTMIVGDDKRQYTGNIIHAANGALVGFQVVYGGKSDRSLPSENIRNQYDTSDWIFGFSDNHWSNIDEKKKLIDYIWQYRTKVLDKLVSEGNISKSAANTAPVVVLLDCWSVNTSKDFRKWLANNYPLIRLRFIPAGMTGKCQINDTFFHSPYKKWVRIQVEDWYSSKFIELTKQLEENSINQETFNISMNDLMGLKNLRDLTVKWNIEALSKLKEKKNGENLITNVWKSSYGQIFDLEFQRRALENQAQILLQPEYDPKDVKTLHDEQNDIEDAPFAYPITDAPGVKIEKAKTIVDDTIEKQTA